MKKCSKITALIFYTLNWFSYVNGTPAFHTVNDYDLNGNKCPLPTKKGVTCPILCVSDISQCPQKVSSICPQGKTFCQDGKCHESCPSDIINPCFCGAENSGWTLKNLASQQCSRSFELQNTPKIYDGSDPGSSMWAICPPPPPPIFTYREPMWIAVFSIVAFQALILMIWHSFKTFAERNAYHMIVSELPPSLSEIGDASALNEKFVEEKTHTIYADNEEDSVEEIGSKFKIQGFVPNFLGTIGIGTIVAMSFGWGIYLAVITADYYGAVTGTKYGIAHDSYDLSSTMFICVWVSATTWFVILNVFKAHLTNYFRIQVNPLQAKYIQIKKPKTTILMMDDSSKALNLVRKIESFLSHALGWDVIITTVSLEKTGTNRLYFNYHCTRFVYHEKVKYFAPHQFELGTTSDDFIKQSSGLSTEEADRRLELKGPNFISVKLIQQ
ncbi:hypothetical protein CONCODRAFT_2784 [Conidiobolus coronatus NRRL 28638]|uniref:Uncharacterized protein n=1 Tax=Conidiobolus coronatus (strain ATCC 28846 / CBS 209.66 / NRRL 28638) TaxID=796925 RepID=A0A137PGX0_CONC2|nr:hypothetical protein CONCODRAFT_2784 [Conidiobolus coronatus NRRL 28638]|eukprot:KXN74246.1 hypothetical protein CONCODRAFT_2784 [Conidiobolus coronatus NRRL 28638]